MSARDASDPAVIEEQYVAFYRALTARAETAITRDDDEVFWAMSGLPHPLGNGVVRTRWSADVSTEGLDARIQETLAPFRERGLPFQWLVWPSSQPSDLGSRLEANGLLGDPEGASPGMTLDLAAPLPETPRPQGLRIEQVRDDATYTRWVDTFLAAYGFMATEENAGEGALLRQIASMIGYAEPMRTYLGRLDERPVATTTLFLADGVAGIFNVATLPEARGRGVGTANTTEALRQARALGAHTAILLSTALGEPIYRRLGFVERCRVEHYYWLPRGGAE